MTAIQTGFDNIVAADVLVMAAKAADWKVVQLDDETVLATLTAPNGDHHAVSINPDADDFPARRSINDTASGATSRVETVLEWLIGTPVRGADLRIRQVESIDAGIILEALVNSVFNEDGTAWQPTDEHAAKLVEIFGPGHGVNGGNVVPIR